MAGIDQNYVKVFFAQGLSQICDRMMMIASIWIISTHYKPEWSSWFLAFGAVPHLFLFKWTPQIIAKYGPLKTILAADWIRGIALILSSLLFLGGWSDSKIIPLFLIYFFVNILAALFNPAIFMLPTFLSNDSNKQKKMIAIIESCFSLSNVIAPIISILLFTAFGLPGLILINGISYLVAWRIEKTLTPVSINNGLTENEPITETSDVSSLYAREPIIIYLLSGFFLLNLLLGPLLVLIPLFASKIYLGDLTTLNGLEFSLALGTLIGSAMLTVLNFGKSTFRKISVLLFLDTLLFTLFCRTTDFITGALCLGLMGFLLAIVNVLIVDFFQTRSLKSELGLVMSYVNVIGIATLPISLSLFGLILNLKPNLLQPLAKDLSVTSLLLVILFISLPIFTIKLKKEIYQ